MRQMSVPFSYPEDHSTAGQALGPREIRHIRLKRASIWSRLLALPLAVVALPLITLSHLGASTPGEEK